MRCIVLSDVHGQPHLIKNVLKHSDYKIGQDRLVFAGDLLDIGTDPDTCLKLLIEANAEMLWGNHDAAIVLRKYISPQDPYSFSLYEKLRQATNFKVAAVHDNVLITHAGVSSNYFKEDHDVNIIAKALNSTPLIDLWSNDNILWYRPDDIPPKSNIVQVVGHTPPEYCRPYENFYMVDPYCKISFNKDRYRYAVIENNNVSIYDSMSRI
jgi:predicted phosphodiesterase